MGNFVTVGRVRVSTASRLHRQILIKRPRSRHPSVRAEWLWAEYVEWAKFKVVFILFFFFIENSNVVFLDKMISNQKVVNYKVS